MELEEPINANDEKSISDSDDVEVIRRVLDEMIESRLKIVFQPELVCISNSECWKETGIKLLSDSTSRIFDGEISVLKEGPPKKRRKNTSDANSDWDDERAKIKAVVVDADFIQKFN
ncbi:NADH-ubiquinone oxidoreductase 29subunit [Dirofilaria immitis]